MNSCLHNYVACALPYERENMILLTRKVFQRWCIYNILLVFISVTSQKSRFVVLWCLYRGKIIILKVNEETLFCAEYLCDVDVITLYKIHYM